MEAKCLVAIAAACLMLTGCSYNPFQSNNHLTGSSEATAIGAGAGVGSAALLGLGNSKPLLGLAGLGGGAIGYYVSTMRFATGNLLRAHGKVYQVGRYVGIYIPTDQLFEANSTEFLPTAEPILDDVSSVIDRFPDDNVLVSGNTSGFGSALWERRLSQRRAEKVAAYLWKTGITAFKRTSNDTRTLDYVGYGDYFPIATHLTNPGIRQNSRIQITLYPSDCDLRAKSGNKQVFHNIGALYKEGDESDSVNTCENGKRCD